MDIAALTIAAARQMQSDPTWTPPLGVLFVRIMFAPWQTSVEFGYVDEEPKGALTHYRSLARIRGWRGEPDHGGGLDCAKGDMDHAGSGAAIVRRSADEDDLRALFRLWEHRVSPAEWLRDIEMLPDLSADSKATIRSALARVGV